MGIEEGKKKISHNELKSKMREEAHKKGSNIPKIEEAGKKRGQELKELRAKRESTTKREEKSKKNSPNNHTEEMGKKQIKSMKREEKMKKSARKEERIKKRNMERHEAEAEKKA